tara:strand:+ start:1117 stop:1503 length:387 start_codon:yes stop_codon:yes gene_type:complete
MKPITLRTVPSTVYDSLAQDVIVSRLQPNGRFVDTYVGELVEGDQFYLPEKELPLASDTEILDYLVSNKPRFTWTITDFVHSGESSVHVFTVDDLNELAERRFKTGDTPALLGAFRELITEVINNEEL